MNRKPFEKTLGLARGDLTTLVMQFASRAVSPEEMKEAVSQATRNDETVPAYLPELALLEANIASTQAGPECPASSPKEHCVNPTLHVVPLSWQLAQLFQQDPVLDGYQPEQGVQFALVWKTPWDNETQVKGAHDGDLLALKLIVEKTPLKEAVAEAGVTPAAINLVIRRAVVAGLVLAPHTKIRRPETFPKGVDVPKRFLASGNFTLQWHITNACDLHCKHCYDRSGRTSIPMELALSVLDQMADFCTGRNVAGHISFSGGNPLLHPHFFTLYQAASNRGFTLNILGNPTDRETLRRIVDIQPPTYFQVSLEGLEEHNDAIRGKGVYKRVLAFLKVLKESKIDSQVMLTLTAHNLDQVLPLAKELEGQVDSFMFNRLSPTGEGAALSVPDPEDLWAFMECYRKEAAGSRHMYLKENLFNRARRLDGEGPFGGCTGFGCGAACNFLALLADGEVHACRKLPSFLGNLQKQTLQAIYDSPKAEKYRSGSSACASCQVRPVCGGCLAVAHGAGLDIFEDRDPYCPGTIA